MERSLPEFEEFITYCNDFFLADGPGQAKILDICAMKNLRCIEEPDAQEEPDLTDFSAAGPGSGPGASTPTLDARWALDSHLSPCSYSTLQLRGCKMPDHVPLSSARQQVSK